jgi:hypothetical protein
MLAGDLFQRFLPVAGGDDRVAFEAKGDFEQFKYVGDVLDDEDGAIGYVHKIILAGIRVEDKSVAMFSIQMKL